MPVFRRRLIPRLTWALFFICFFVVFSGFGILSRLPEGGVNDHAAATVDFQTVRTEVVRTYDWRTATGPSNFHGYQNGSDEWLFASPDWVQDKLMVYSSYWDNRTVPSCVRIIGTAMTKRSPSVICKVYFQDGKSVDVIASKKAINEHWNLKYAGFIFSCCSGNFGTFPTKVTISHGGYRDSSATLPIHVNPRGYKGQLALCVKPFHFNFNRATWLIEFIEYYRMMGVEYFLLYNESVGDEVSKVLQYYLNQNILDVMPWRMYVEHQKEIRTQNMFAAINDCNYRLMYVYKYVLFVDFDEYIVPKNHDNFNSMMDALTKSKGKLCTPSYVFQNVFFYLYWSNDTTLFKAEPETSPQFVPYLLTQYKTRRLVEPHKHGKRSKFIAVPEMVLEIGNHLTWRHTGPCKPDKVSSSVALMHHYRICEYGGFDCLKMPSKEDRTAHKFGVKLLNLVNASCHEIFDGNPCPISPPLGSPW